MRKNIGIIGGGSAGLVLAWSLRDIHNVVLFEKETKAGGHAYSHQGQEVNVDMGVEYFSEKMAPNFMALLKTLDIPTYVAPMTFLANFEGERDEYWCNYNHLGSLWKRLHKEFEKFHYHMNTILYDEQTKNKSLCEYISENNYSDDFIQKALVPMLTTFASYSSQSLEYTLSFCALLFSRNLLSFFCPTYLRKVKGGISSYIDLLSNLLKDKIILNSKIDNIERTDQKVKIHTNNTVYEFDEVIFATHADQALSMIKNPSNIEKDTLQNFEYNYIQSVLHSDDSMLTKNIPNKPYCEFSARDDNPLNGSLTRNSNQLEFYSKVKEPLLVTYNPHKEIKSNLIIAEKNWKVPKLRPNDLQNKRRIKEIQGKNKFWFCGTDTNYTGHEGSIASALVIAEQFGAEYPFKDDKLASAQYDLAKSFMGMNQINTYGLESTKTLLNLYV